MKCLAANFVFYFHVSLSFNYLCSHLLQIHFYFPFVLILFDIVFNNWQSFFILFYSLSLSFNLTICLLFFFSFSIQSSSLYSFCFCFTSTFFFMASNCEYLTTKQNKTKKLVHYALNVLFSKKKYVCLSSRCCCYSSVLLEIILFLIFINNPQKFHFAVF